MDIKTKNVIANRANILTDNDIIDFAQLSCEDPNLMDFMVGVNDDALIAVTSDLTKRNNKFKCDEWIIPLKSTDHKKKFYQEAVEFFSLLYFQFIQIILLLEMIYLYQNSYSTWWI